MMLTPNEEGSGPSTSYDPGDLGLDGSLLTTALDIHRELLTRSIS